MLVLCYGNIYRSPFVEARLSSLLEDSEWAVRSAGFYDRENRQCADEFVSLAGLRGVDIKSHRSCRVRQEDIAWADVIVIMDCHNRDLLLALDSASRTKIVWIAAWQPGLRADVRDPFGRPQDKVNVITSRLFQAADSLARELRVVSSGTSGDSHEAKV